MQCQRRDAAIQEAATTAFDEVVKLLEGRLELTETDHENRTVSTAGMLTEEQIRLLHECGFFIKYMVEVDNGGIGTLVWKALPDPGVQLYTCGDCGTRIPRSECVWLAGVCACRACYDRAGRSGKG